MNAPIRRPGEAEFVIIIASMYATIALSIDAMLPALPEIGAQLTPDNLNRAQLILPAFLFGMGGGTLIAGPISDAFGRRVVILGGAILFGVASILCWFANTLELMLIARFVQGLGASCPRVIGIAVMRDSYQGREMARLMSFVMMVFTFVPAFAPFIGAQIIALAGWRAIFIAFVLFSLLTTGWFMIRQPETLPADQRRPLQLGTLWAGIREIMTTRIAALSIAVQTAVFSLLFMSLVSVQQVFDIYFGRGDQFPYWFALIAVVGGMGTLINARYVGRLGMRYIVRTALSVQVVLSLSVLILFDFHLLPRGAEFAVYVLWAMTLFSLISLTIGNLNAMMMQPLGHVAGLAASLAGALSTVFSLIIATPVGLAFDGTPVPLTVGAFCAVLVARLLMVLVPPGEEEAAQPA